MLYDYLLTMFKVIVGLITTERMIYFALGAVGLYFIWICFSLLVCFQKRFYRNSVKLYNFAKKNALDKNHPEILDKKISKISKGFYYGWRKFKTAEYGKPSEYITRREALDVEVNGGVLNQGKSFMKAFIGFVSVFLFVFNLAYLSGNEGLSLYLLAESFVLPLILFTILKVFYYIYTSMKQQLYKQDVECFYDLVLVLDEIYAKGDKPVFVQESAVALKSATADEELAQTAEAEEQEIKEELLEEEAEAEPEEVVEESAPKQKTIDDYDVFKKKNIDVEKLLNEVPQSGTTLPYIDVDSDYVIKDDDTPITKVYSDKHNGSDVLGGMLQDMSSIKKMKENENFIDVDKEIATIDTEKTIKAKNDEQTEKSEESEDSKEETDPAEKLVEQTDNSKVEATDLFDALSEFEVKTEEEQKVQEEISEKPEEPEVVEEKVEQPEKPEVKEEVKVEEPEVVQAEPAEPVVAVKTQSTEELTEEKKENIANIVGGFKSNRSKLANGGVVIERNEPHRSRKNEYQSNYDDGFVSPTGITRLETNEDENSILNSIKGSTSIYDSPSYDVPVYDPYAGVNPMYNQGYGVPNYNQGYNGYGAGYIQGQPQQPYMQNPTYDAGAGYNSYAGYDESYEEPEEAYEEDFEEESVDISDALEVIQEARKATKAKKEQKQEPAKAAVAKKSTKAKEKAVMEEEVKVSTKTRGRPKKQVFDETLTIKSDKEFDQVLSRAEKLMRKSDEGLSASQSKRIEKELKMLMDAMNRYKEGK